MTAVGEIVLRLLPDGPNPGAPRRSKACPAWPADVFAVAATLVERSGCYCAPWYTVGWDNADFHFSRDYRERVRRAGAAWARRASPPRRVRELWSVLVGHRRIDISDAARTWQDTAVELMAIADEASQGIGFSDAESLKNPFAELLLAQHALLAERRPLSLRVPQSLCLMVPPSEACVQPKTNTPEVGCTLRSLSHHLALLPPAGLVATSWLFATTRTSSFDHPLNLLLVPFPYVLHGRSFAASQLTANSPVGFFSIDADSWLPGEVGKFADFLCELVKCAEREAATVHGIVLPETALSLRQARKIAAYLEKSLPSLELFIAGATDRESNRNLAYTSRFFVDGLHEQTQSKHHRWCLNRSQIVRYHLGTILDPERLWWEQIDVHSRTCAFTEIRRGTSLAVLVCEDLARADPVLPVISSVGPNLVIALLMDGPQVEARWPGRYATILADDPGSSVLTLTCLGMVRRFTMPGEPDAHQIALWKEPGGLAREIKLPARCHAMLLTITAGETEQNTLDMRSDDTATVRLHLSGVRDIRLADSPPWLELD